MTDRTHYEGCWRTHLECAVAKVEELEERLRWRKYPEEKLLMAFVQKVAREHNIYLYSVHDEAYCAHYLPDEAQRLIDELQKEE